MLADVAVIGGVVKVHKMWDNLFGVFAVNYLYLYVKTQW